MTIIDTAPPVEAAALTSALVETTTEQEWCTLCVTDEESAADPEAGMPREVVSRFIDQETLPGDWLPEWGEAGEFEVTLLSCGHHLSRRL